MHTDMQYLKIKLYNKSLTLCTALRVKSHEIGNIHINYNISTIK